MVTVSFNENIQNFHNLTTITSAHVLIDYVALVFADSISFCAVNLRDFVVRICLGSICQKQWLTDEREANIHGTFSRSERFLFSKIFEFTSNGQFNDIFSITISQKKMTEWYLIQTRV